MEWDGWTLTKKRCILLFDRRVRVSWAVDLEVPPTKSLPRVTYN